jgi:hypothetical protein
MATVVAIGPGFWGKGEDEKEAKGNLRKHGGKLADGYLLVTFPEGVVFEGVDDFGRYHYRSEDGTPPQKPEERLVEGRLTR